MRLDWIPPGLPDILGCFAFNVNFNDIDYFSFTKNIIDENNFVWWFDIWQNVDVQDLIERI